MAGEENRQVLETAEADEVQEPGEALPEEWNEDSTDPEAGPGEHTEEAPAGDSTEAGPGGQDGERAEEAGNRDSGSGGLKVVIDIGNERASVGVIREGVDVHLEMLLDDDLHLIAGELPGIIERALERWESEPMRPKYTAPKKQRSGGKTAERSAGKKTADQPEAVQQALEPVKATMNRLF